MYKYKLHGISIAIIKYSSTLTNVYRVIHQICSPPFFLQSCSYSKFQNLHFQILICILICRIFSNYFQIIEIMEYSTDFCSILKKRPVKIKNILQTTVMESIIDQKILIEKIGS